MLFNDALEENGVNAELYTQSVNSPDVNLLDLGFFRAIQSFNDAAPRNEEELIKAVSEAYDNYPKEKLNQTWLTLQCCFSQIITHHGDNDYNIDIGVDVFFLLFLLFPPHLGEWVGFLGAFMCFSCVF